MLSKPRENSLLDCLTAAKSVSKKTVAGAMRPFASLGQSLLSRVSNVPRPNHLHGRRPGEKWLPSCIPSLPTHHVAGAVS